MQCFFSLDVYHPCQSCSCITCCRHLQFSCVIDVRLEFPYSWFTLTTVAWEKSTVVATLGSAPFFCTHPCKTVFSQTNPVFVYWFQQMPRLFIILHITSLSWIQFYKCLCVEGWAKGGVCSGVLILRHLYLYFDFFYLIISCYILVVYWVSFL